MAEETDGFHFSNKANKSGGDSSLHQGVTVKQHPATKKVPHYLRTSTGSCHDACKYGHPHKTKDIPTCLVRRRMSTPLPDDKKMADIQIFVDHLPSVKQSAPPTTSGGKLKKSSAKSPVSDSSSARLVKQQVRSFTKSPSSKVPKVVINKAAVQSSDDRSSKTPKQEVVLAAKKSVLPKRIPLHPKERNNAAFSGDTISRGGRVKQSPLLFETLRKSNQEASSTTNITQVSSKRIPLISSKKRNGSEEGILKPSLSQRTSKVETKKLLHPKTTTAAGKSLKLGQRPRNQGEAKEPPFSDEKAGEEKTLHMIDKKQDESKSNTDLLIQSPSPLSPESLNSSSQTTTLSFTSQEIEDQSHLDAEYTDIISADYSDDSRLTMKPKLSKTAQPESETNNLRRLHFRQGRTLDSDDDSQGANSGAQWLSYTKKAADCTKEEVDSVVVKVVLKHQEMETKKDEQVSLNNVIEETASKLVEKRKSKVKALVGAFESVISLHEQKPPPSAANR